MIFIEKFFKQKLYIKKLCPFLVIIKNQLKQLLPHQNHVAIVFYRIR